MNKQTINSTELRKLHQLKQKINMKVLVKWDDGTEYVVPTQDLKRDTGDWRRQVVRLKVGEKVKMLCGNSWVHGSISSVDIEMIKKQSSNIPPLKTEIKKKTSSLDLIMQRNLESFQHSKVHSISSNEIDLQKSCNLMKNYPSCSDVLKIAECKSDLLNESVRNADDTIIDKNAIDDNNKHKRSSVELLSESVGSDFKDWNVNLETSENKISSEDVLQSTKNTNTMPYKSIENNAEYIENPPSSANLNIVIGEAFTLKDDVSFSKGNFEIVESKPYDVGLSGDDSIQPNLKPPTNVTCPTYDVTDVHFTHNKSSKTVPATQIVSPYDVGLSGDASIQPNIKPPTNGSSYDVTPNKSSQTVPATKIVSPTGYSVVLGQILTKICLIKPCSVILENNILPSIKTSAENELNINNSIYELNAKSKILPSKHNLRPKRINNFKNMPYSNNIKKLRPNIPKSIDKVSKNLDETPIMHLGLSQSSLEQSVPSLDIEAMSIFIKGEMNNKNLLPDQLEISKTCVAAEFHNQLQIVQPLSKQSSTTSNLPTNNQRTKLFLIDDVEGEDSKPLEKESVRRPINKKFKNSPITKNTYIPTNKAISSITNANSTPPADKILKLDTLTTKPLSDTNVINEPLVNRDQGELSIASGTSKHLEPTPMEYLDGVPPFIQEVFKCENIRDGFINADLVFVLSLLPDIEEMTESEKIQFQLQVIGLLNDVLNDPQLQA